MSRIQSKALQYQKPQHRYAKEGRSLSWYLQNQHIPSQRPALFRHFRSFGDYKWFIVPATFLSAGYRQVNLFHQENRNSTILVL